MCHKAGYSQPKDEVVGVSCQLSVVSAGGYFEILGFGSMEEVFTIMCRFV